MVFTQGMGVVQHLAEVDDESEDSNGCHIVMPEGLICLLCPWFPNPLLGSKSVTVAHTTAPGTLGN